MGEPAEACVWTREETIERLRQGLLALCDDDHSMCEVAAQRNIFCRGFRRWHDAEFHRKWKAVIGQSTHLTRAQMERFANIWQLSEQIRCRVGLACDAQTIAHGPCRGWDEFSNETLARFCDEVLGRNVIVLEARNDEVSVFVPRSPGMDEDPSAAAHRVRSRVAPRTIRDLDSLPRSPRG